MVPLLLAFMVDVVQPLGVLQRHIEGLEALNHVLSYLIIAGNMNRQSMIELQSLIEKHMIIYEALYSDIVKPKFHHQIDHHLTILSKSSSNIDSSFLSVK